MSAEKNTTEKIEVQAVQTEQTKDAAGNALRFAGKGEKFAQSAYLC